MKWGSVTARYLWHFFVGDSLQLLGLLGVFLIAALLRAPLGRWDGPLTFLLVMATVWLDVSQRAAAQRRVGP